MENVVKLAEILGSRAKKAAERAAEAEKRRAQPQKMSSAEIKRFSRDNAWVSYHDVITADKYVPKMRRLCLNREIRVNYGKIVDILKSYGLLKKRTEYGVAFHEIPQIYEIYESFSGNAVLLVKSSECSQVWDW